MIITVLVIVLTGIALGCLYQWTQGYTRFELGLYFQELIAIQGVRFAFLIVRGLLAHTLAPHSSTHAHAWERVDGGAAAEKRG